MARKLLLLGFLAVVFGATAIAGGIDIGAPLISGDVSSPQSAGHADLSPEQLQAISRWLELHRSGWQGMITPATSEPIQFQVKLTHSDGHTTTMCVIARASGGYYLRLTGPGVMAYRSFGGIFQSWAATRALSGQDIAALHSLVGAPTQ